MKINNATAVFQALRFWSSIWRSFCHWKGHLFIIPKRSQKELRSSNIFFPQRRYKKADTPKLLEAARFLERILFQDHQCRFVYGNSEINLTCNGIDMSPKRDYFPKLSNPHSRDTQNKTIQGLYYCFSNQKTINLTPCKFNSSPLKKKRDWKTTLLSR